MCRCFPVVTLWVGETQHSHVADFRLPRRVHSPIRHPSAQSKDFLEALASSPGSESSIWICIFVIFFPCGFLRGRQWAPAGPERVTGRPGLADPVPLPEMHRGGYRASQVPGGPCCVYAVFSD